jgi:hypothetical protein
MLRRSSTRHAPIQAHATPPTALRATLGLQLMIWAPPPHWLRSAGITQEPTRSQHLRRSETSVLETPRSFLLLDLQRAEYTKQVQERIYTSLCKRADHILKSRKSHTHTPLAEAFYNCKTFQLIYHLNKTTHNCHERDYYSFASAETKS